MQKGVKQSKQQVDTFVGSGPLLALTNGTIECARFNFNYFCAKYRSTLAIVASRKAFSSSGKYVGWSADKSYSAYRSQHFDKKRGVQDATAR